MTALSRPIPFGQPMLGEEEIKAVVDSLKSPQLVHGPRAAAFETSFSEFLGERAYCTTVSSATAGLHLIYLASGIGRGDEVIVPALTHVATAHAVSITGAQPIFADVDPVSGNISINQIAALITPRTKAICVVHYLGLPVEMEPILHLAKEKSLLLVEDCALALGARINGTHVGLLGDVGVFSFYPAKHITTAEGGMVCSKNPELISRISNIKSFGYDKNLNERSVPGVYDIKALGLNLRMSEMSAAMGQVQMTKLSEFLARRQENMDNMRKELESEESFSLAPEAPVNCQHANYCAVVTVKKATLETRNQLLLRLKDSGVGCSVYYPVPLPLSKYYASNSYSTEKDFVNAGKFSYRSVALPVGPHITPQETTLLAKEFIEVAQDLNLR